jgi:ketosteroid isomerase-like protein
MNAAPEAVLASQFQAFVDKDLDGLLAHWQPDCTFRDLAEPAARHGLEDLRAYMAENMARMHDIDARFVALVGSGDQALAEILMDVTWRDETTPPGGVRVTLGFCVVDEIRDGLVQRETVYWNPQTLADQLVRFGRAAPST